MRQLTDEELRICEIQGEIFVLSIEETECSSPIFVRRYMKSRIANRMDTGMFFMEAIESSDLLEELNQEYGATEYGKVKYPQEIMYWMGYLYRYWSYALDIRSSSIFNIASAREMSELYAAYHTMSPEQAIERIYEAHGMKPLDFMERQYEIMRQIIYKNELLSPRTCSREAGNQ